MKITNKKAYLIVLAPLGFILNLLAKAFPIATSKYYSKGVYKALAGSLGRFFSIFPFSVAEVIIILLIVGLMVFLFLLINKLVKSKGERLPIIKNTFVNLLAIVSVVYFVFIVTCGINYHQPTFAKQYGLNIQKCSSSQLQDLALYLIDETNESRESLVKSENFSVSPKDAQQAMASFSDETPILRGYTTVPKSVKSSYIMSHFNITGVYFPFTFEANINTHVTDYSVASTMLHELAHFKGFMKESDANFIAYLSGIKSGNPIFDYSSNMMALNYTLNACYKEFSKEEYASLYSLLSEGIKNDYRQSSEYWSQFETPLTEVSESVNNAYLKANYQESGIKSYGEVVDSLIAYYLEYIA